MFIPTPGESPERTGERGSDLGMSWLLGGEVGMVGKEAKLLLNEFTLVRITEPLEHDLVGSFFRWFSRYS